MNLTRISPTKHKAFVSNESKLISKVDKCLLILQT